MLCTIGRGCATVVYIALPRVIIWGFVLVCIFIPLLGALQVYRVHFEPTLMPDPIYSAAESRYYQVLSNPAYQSYEIVPNTSQVQVTLGLSCNPTNLQGDYELQQPDFERIAGRSDCPYAFEGSQISSFQGSDFDWVMLDSIAPFKVTAYTPPDLADYATFTFMCLLTLGAAWLGPSEGLAFYRKLA